MVNYMIIFRTNFQIDNFFKSTALEKNTQRLAEKIVSGWVWTSKKFEGKFSMMNKIPSNFKLKKKMKFHRNFANIDKNFQQTG
jgi:hypothetical protein